MIKSVRLKVKNFGYVGEGEIELVPITVLIGPNNTGKSYTAMLLYALIKSTQRIIETIESPQARSAIMKDLKKLSSTLMDLVHEYREKFEKLGQGVQKEPRDRQKIEE